MFDDDRSLTREKRIEAASDFLTRGRDSDTIRAVVVLTNEVSTLRDFVKELESERNCAKCHVEDSEFCDEVNAALATHEKRGVMEREERIIRTLRDLVAGIFNDCVGAYGAGDGNPYAGNYEREIQAVAKVIAEDDEPLGPDQDRAAIALMIDHADAALDWKPPVKDVAALPEDAEDHDARRVESEGEPYVYSAKRGAWESAENHFKADRNEEPEEPDDTPCVVINDGGIPIDLSEAPKVELIFKNDKTGATKVVTPRVLDPSRGLVEVVIPDLPPIESVRFQTRIKLPDGRISLSRAISSRELGC